MDLAICRVRYEISSPWTEDRPKGLVAQRLLLLRSLLRYKAGAVEVLE